MSKADELETIRDQMLDLLQEAASIVQGTSEESRARAYWLPQIEMVLTKDHGFLGGSMCDMEDTINALREEEEED